MDRPACRPWCRASRPRPFRSFAAMIGVGLITVGLTGPARRAGAQLVSLTDDIIVLSKAQQEKERARTLTPLGRAPGAGGNPFRSDPGGRGKLPQDLINPAQSAERVRGANRDALSAASTPGAGFAQRPEPLRMAAPRLANAEPSPIYGTLDLPAGDDEGPPNGLTLDQAITLLVRGNYELRSKAYEIPQARADVLTAGLRANPFVFFSAANYPYQAYSPTRPGGVNYSGTVIQPWDINHKRRARTEAASRAMQVLEAQYQDAVRMAIDDLYTAYLDVLVARETLRYAQASHVGLNRLLRAAETQRRGGQLTPQDVDQIAIQRDAADMGTQQAGLMLEQATRSLAAMLALPPAEAERLQIRGGIRDVAPPPAPRAELVRAALARRPDLAAFRLGIERARADVKLLRKERFADVFLLYTPYQEQLNGPVGGKNATSWSVGGFATVPIYNRNQGEIRRADLNVAQTRVALAGLERQVVVEVERAEAEYRSSRQAVDRLQGEIVPRSLRIREAAHRLFQSGEKSIVDYLNAQKNHNEVVRQYRDTLIRHRRSMLRLNTAVAERILP